MRREYVSGFTGSSGDAVVTLTRAVVWTDSRYYLQAESQLDCNWELVKTGEDGVSHTGAKNIDCSFTSLCVNAFVLHFNLRNILHDWFL